MNIEEFYDADERRRDSEELELGGEWHGPGPMPYTLSYVVDTGELYLMAAPEAEAIEDGFGDISVDDESVEGLTVEIIAHVPSADDLHVALDGWETEMGTPNSIEWLRARVSGFPSA